MTSQHSPLQTAAGLPSLADILAKCDFARLSGHDAAPTAAHLLRTGARLLAGDSRPEARALVAQIEAILPRLEKQDG